MTSSATPLPVLLSRLRKCETPLQEFLEELDELNDDFNSNDPGRQARAALELLLFAATIRAGRGEGEVLRPKPVNLPGTCLPLRRIFDLRSVAWPTASVVWFIVAPPFL